ncbi:MAG TPA: DUF47 family protein [Candidatus Hydrogenedentes bacterium]|nr:DUF47 family protein [Candidatus Hydrogenedentota bacterium]
MFRNLLPKEENFFDFFEQHCRLAIEACNELYGMVSTSGDMTVRAARIKEIEREADSITHVCTDTLHKTFITPIDRSEILGLMQRLDDIVDSVESIAARLVMYDIQESRAEAVALVDVLVRASQEIIQAVTGLRNMKNQDTIKMHCIKLFDLENEGDILMRNALADLFKHETDPIKVIKWKEILERLEKATDRCESVANIIQGIVIENS